MTTHHKLALAAWLSLAGAVYLTLLPFDFRFETITFDQAVANFGALDFGPLRASARQQWIANALMFVPLGFFWAAWLGGGSRGGLRLLAVVAAALLGLVVTASVEFLQSWIPRRAPSLLDMSGNFSGAALGAVVWLLWGESLRRGLARLGSGGWPALSLAFTLYAVTYLVASLLPLDFMLSFSELVNKLNSTHWGIWAAPAGCSVDLRCAALRGVELLVVVPIGIAFALLWRRRTAGGLRMGGARLAACALLFGVGMELLQFLTVSGVAEGRSALFRAIGLVLGFRLVLAWPAGVAWRLPSWSRPALVAISLLYMSLLLGLNLGGNAFQLESGSIVIKLGGLNFLPFYYHYRVAEATAIFSVLTHLCMYAPVGLLVWLWGLAREPRGAHGGAGYGTAALVFSIVLALVLAALVEGGKLFMAGLHPDPTTPWLAALAAGATYRACGWLRDVVLPEAQASTAVAPLAAVPTGLSPPQPLPVRAWLPWGLGASLALAALYWAATWPVAALWLTLGLVLYGAWLWRQPAAWLLVIPALVPVLNLSLYSGNFFFDELDLFLLLTVAILLLHRRQCTAQWRTPVLLKLALSLYAISLVGSLALALLPLPAVDANSWVHYANPYNALRAAKGGLWALLLFLLLRRSGLEPVQLLRQWFLPGMVLGLVGVVAVVLWERATYPGVLDMNSRYRVTGLFTDMHTGGPGIETWLVMTLPFVLLWAWLHRAWWSLLAAAVLFAGGLYALVVTYSRAGYGGLGVGVVVILVGLLAAIAGASGAQRLRLAFIALVPAGVAAVLLPVVMGPFLEQRMSQVDADFEMRKEHWTLAMELRQPGARARLLGAGPGAFPGAYAFARPNGVLPGNFAFVGSPDGPALRLGTGDSLFINQRIALAPAGVHVVEVEARADQPARLRMSVCEKFVRHSYTCRNRSLQLGMDDQSLSWRFRAEDLGEGPWFARRSLVLSLSNSTAGSIIEVNRVSVRDPEGRELLRNTGFEDGARHWYFTTDHLWPWRIENLWLEILFDQGWLGVLAFTALVLVAAAYLGRRSLQGDLQAAVVLASLAGVLSIGLLSSVFWSPRLMLMFLLVLLVGVMGTQRPERPGPRRSRRRASSSGAGLASDAR